MVVSLVKRHPLEELVAKLKSGKTKTKEHVVPLDSRMLWWSGIFKKKIMFEQARVIDRFDWSLDQEINKIIPLNKTRDI